GLRGDGPANGGAGIRAALRPGGGGIAGMKLGSSGSLRRLLQAAALMLMVGCGEEELPVQELITLRNQGLLELERGQLPEAEARFARLVAAAPNEPLGHANLGLTLLRAGRLEEAAEH